MLALHVSSNEMIEFLTILEDGRSIRTIQVEDEQGTSNVQTFSKLLFMPLTPAGCGDAIVDAVTEVYKK